MRFSWVILIKNEKDLFLKKVFDKVDKGHKIIFCYINEEELKNGFNFRQ
jgi:hypothetical protein